MTSLGIITITQSTLLHYDNGIESPKTETGNEEAVEKKKERKKNDCKVQSTEMRFWKDDMICIIAIRGATHGDDTPDS